MTVIDSTQDVPGLVEGCQLTVIPNHIPTSECDDLADEAIGSGHLRQYTRKHIHQERRLHVNLHEQAGDGYGYRYKDVTMQSLPYNAIDGAEPVIRKVESVAGTKFNIGVDLVVYTDGSDSIGWHCDDSQGERSVAGLILRENEDDPRPLMFRPLNNTSGKQSFNLRLSKGSIYVMNDAFNKHYQHMVPKRDRAVANYQRIVMVCRDGDKAIVGSDSGCLATLESRLNRPPTHRFGSIDGLEEGALYGREKLFQMYAHRAERKAVSGNRHCGCDSVVLNMNNPKRGEVDGTFELLDVSAAACLTIRCNPSTSQNF